MQSKHWVMIVLLTLFIIAGIVLWIFLAREQQARAMLEREKAMQERLHYEHSQEMERLRKELEAAHDQL